MASIAATDHGTAPQPPVAPDRRRRSRLKMRNTLVGWSFILPNFLGFGLLTLVPIVVLFYMSFTNWNVFGKADWIGFTNYQRLIGDGSFQISVINTLYYSALHIPLTIIVSLGLALLLNNKLRGVAFFRTAAFFPYITSIVAIAVVWNLLFSPEYGPINEGLRFLGIQNPPGWLTSPEWAMPAVVIVSTWRDMGYYMILFLAGLQTVPRELHEAARMDGANVWQRFVNVTIPCLRPTMFFVTVMLTINSFKIFDLILVMTEGGPGQSTLVLSQFIFRKGFEESQYGYASAASVALFFLCIIVTVVQFVWNKKRST
ncbi:MULTISPECIES: carbohydrate ABC transporter permease [Microbacterium]|jgi:ABC-type sugar transport system permease subunit|uniref:carbohydrate ABC transporter permease n=1 Tax=Microbacterium TaxID=33882 RepID=UPI0007005705|nr:MULTISPECIES: sugar ABC transporter permease [Microbacterium]KQR25765.1 ABC transporter permease [Microbacterium sp. Leaf151]MCI9858553.1 sugar ABC transporter permease [Microbacterium proteolyticum]